MKKIKRILAVLLLCVMALSLTGCAELDEMKAVHGVWGDEEGTVVYNGQIYRSVTPTPMLGVWDPKGDVYVTDADVPVLLSGMYGDTMMVGESGILLESYEWAGDSAVLYCREDHYESVMTQIASGPVLSEMLYTYWDDWDEESNDKEYRLSAQEIAAVEALLSGVPGATGVDRFNLEESFSFYLQKASADGLFRTDLCEVSVCEQEIRLLTDPDYDGSVDVYSVPAEQQAIFQKIIKEYASMEWIEYEAPPEFEHTYTEFLDYPADYYA